jgi:undecaprenyl diphosphate synthase
MASNDHIPQHVAIIMDGNGRWARKRALPRHAGHRSGVGSVRQAVETAAQRGVEVLTLFAFSSENWSRPREEVSKLMGLFVEALQREVDELHLNNVRLEFVGARGLLQASLVEKIASAEEQTRENTGLRLIVAVAYGGRWDIAQAAKRLAGRAVAGEIAVEDIDDAAVAQELQLRDVRDPDLLIRTGGEQRISNFLLWHLAYSELYFCDTLWPDFGEAQFDAALDFFAQRQRRYGHTAEQVEAVGS